MSVKQIVMAAAGALGGGGGGEASDGEAVFTAAGETNWVVPSNVTSISAVIVGGGGGGHGSISGGSGGGGGDLRYINNLSVTPNETLKITVGAGGAVSESGGFTRIERSDGGGGFITLLEAAGGGRGTNSGSEPKVGTSSTIGGNIGGGDGGVLANSGVDVASGGAGAGGYSGKGGDGASSANTAGDNGIGGGGGGGGSGGASDHGGMGGGVNVFGQGINGQGGDGSVSDGDSATGGSWGDGGLNTNSTATAIQMLHNFGAGGCGADNDTEGGLGGSGVVRIVWDGSSRSFPDTDVWMSQIITTVIETQSSSNTIAIPESAQAGDLAVLANMHETPNSQSDPTGWTRILNHESVSPIMTIWYRILESGDAGQNVTVTSGTTLSAELYIFRKTASQQFSSVNVVDPYIERYFDIIPDQVKSTSTANPPFIVFGYFATPITYNSTGDMQFKGGLAGTGNIEPSAVYTGTNNDATRQIFGRFRIYDQAISNNVTVFQTRDVSNQTMASFILEVN